MIEWKECETALGRVFLAYSSRGLCRLSFGDRVEREVAWLKAHFPHEAVRGPVTGPGRVGEAERQLQEYLAGRRRVFDLPLDLNGTSFQLAVWRTLLTVPFGATTSYGELARRAGFPQAARAVGGAMRANPVAVVVPCHRVLKADGALGCYAGGRPRKRFLLDLEGVKVKE
ncbi:MAG: methylated-DNA-[protein]-cysteine S-methyltransferase [Bacillota bacterium]|nr:methylated-DNA-[protein]-cysteine S-methyltransferase [Bacillota bacterium]